MKTLALVGWIGAFTLAVVVYPATYLLASRSVEAYMIVAHDPARRDAEKLIFDPPKGVSKESKAYRDAVMGIYGSVTDEPTRVLFPRPEKIVHPDELPSLTLLLVDKEKGENPLQVKTVYFFAERSVVGFIVAGVVFLIVWVLVSRRRKPGAAPPPAPPARPA